MSKKEIMRVLYIEPSVNDYLTLFKSTPLKNGGALSDISIFTAPHRRGGGVLGTLFSLGKRIFPFLFRSAAPAAMQFGQSVLTDISNKRNIRNSLKNHGITALKQTGANLLRNMKGSGKCRSRTSKGKIVKINRKKTRGKTYKGDVFDLI